MTGMLRNILVVCPLIMGGWPVCPAAAANPVPSVAQPLVPPSATPGDAAFALTVNGNDFVAGAVVNWNGSPRTTTFVTSHRLTAAINAADVATAGTATITVSNPPPGGGPSNVAYFPVATLNTNVFFAGPSAPLASTGAINPIAVTAADLRGLGILDLIVGYFNCNFNVSPEVCGPSFISVMLGRGDGTFLPPVNYATAATIASIVAQDFNGDGKLDLAAAAIGGNAVSILLGNGDGTFQPHVDYPTGGASSWVVAGDFNNDGKLDLATTNNDTLTISILLGNGDGTFQPHQDFPTFASPQAADIGDFNGDGNLDIAVNHLNESPTAPPPNLGSTVSIFLGKGDGTFQPERVYPTGLGPNSVLAADVNGDGILDLVTPNAGVKTVSVLLGNGDGSFQPNVDYPLPNGGAFAAIGDFNGDQKADLIVSNGSGFSLLLGNGSGTFQPHLDFSGSGIAANGMTFGDFNRDGRLDVAPENFTSNDVSILLQSPSAYTNTITKNFGPVSVGTGVPNTITLFNSDSTALAVKSLVIGGTNAGDFKASGCASAVPAGSSCQIAVTFTPGSAGPRSGLLTVNDNLGSQIVNLLGTGEGRPSISGAVTGMSKAGTQLRISLRLTNNGQGPAENVSITSLSFRTLGGSGSETFAGTLPVNVGNISQGASTTVQLTLNVPATVTKLSVSENGTVQDFSGVLFGFSSSQVVFP